jgi:WD40 repeat protein
MAAAAAAAAAAVAAAPAPVSGAWLHHHSSAAAAAAAALSSNWWDTLSGGAGRLLQRCMGHCNVQTDIKEAVFLGADDALVACGSDDGRVFIYEGATGESGSCEQLTRRWWGV